MKSAHSLLSEKLDANQNPHLGLVKGAVYSIHGRSGRSKPISMYIGIPNLLRKAQIHFLKGSITLLDVKAVICASHEDEKKLTHESINTAGWR